MCICCYLKIATFIYPSKICDTVKINPLRLVHFMRGGKAYVCTLIRNTICIWSVADSVSHSFSYLPAPTMTVAEAVTTVKPVPKVTCFNKTPLATGVTAGRRTVPEPAVLS